MVKELYAHSANPQGQRRKLDDRPQEVAVFSRKFADKFNSAGLAYWAGLLPGGI